MLIGLALLGDSQAKADIINDYDDIILMVDTINAENGDCGNYYVRSTAIVSGWGFRENLYLGNLKDSNLNGLTPQKGSLYTDPSKFDIKLINSYTNLKSYQNKLGKLSTNCKLTFEYGRGVIEGQEDINVINIDSSTLNNIGEIHLKIKDNSLVIFNISGDTVNLNFTLFKDGRCLDDNSYCKNIIYNIQGSGNINVSCHAVCGSLLAVDRNFTGENGHVSGNAYLHSFTNCKSYEVHNNFSFIGIDSKTQKEEPAKSKEEPAPKEIPTKAKEEPTHKAEETYEPEIPISPVPDKKIPKEDQKKEEKNTPITPSIHDIPNIPAKTNESITENTSVKSL